MVALFPKNEIQGICNCVVYLLKRRLSLFTYVAI